MHIRFQFEFLLDLLGQEAVKTSVYMHLLLTAEKLRMVVMMSDIKI